MTAAGTGKGVSPAMLWEARLASALHRGEGVRFGEAAVVSRRVHTVDLMRPGAVSVLRHLDAGQVFYGRRRRDEILHVDLFHAVARVDPHGVAVAVCRTLQAHGRPDLAHDIDIQTGLGGGRVTGSLGHGTRPSLLAAHQNHVHLAALLPDSALSLVLPLLIAVEEAIQAQRVDLRRVEALHHPPAPESAPPLDLSYYSDFTDSRLRERGDSGSESRAGGAPQPENVHAGSLAAPALPAAPASPAPGWPPTALPQPDPEGEMRAALAEESRLQEAVRLAGRLGSPAEIHRLLSAARDGLPLSSDGTGLPALPLLRDLEEEGLVRRDGRTVRLTEAGLELAQVLDRHLREVTLRYRRRLRRVPREALPFRSRPGERPSLRARYGPVRPPVPVQQGMWLGDLAVPETVLAGVRRTWLARVQGPVVSPEPCGLRLNRTDIHVYRRAAHQPLYVCLLLDASASMAGRRILAAKHLVRHLLVSTRDRVALVAFQEREVRVQVPFTRDYARVEAALSRLQPFGLTPLAHGLVAGLDLVRRTRGRRPLLLLVTDGIPTVPRWTVDPLADAVEAARQVARSRVPFGCVGLMPSRRYLEELIRAGGGTLHVVEELEESSLLRILYRERRRVRCRA